MRDREGEREREMIDRKRQRERQGDVREMFEGGGLMDNTGWEFEMEREIERVRGTDVDMY